MNHHQQYMHAAITQAQEALNLGEFPVGCVIAGPEGILASGQREGSILNGGSETEHAEIIALRHLNQNYPDRPREDLVIYSTMEPCLMCFGAILISGITAIVYAYEDAMGGATSCDLQALPPLYANSGVVITPHVMREESLALFKCFFSRPGNTYWKNSFLESYTLSAK